MDQERKAESGEELTREGWEMEKEEGESIMDRLKFLVAHFGYYSDVLIEASMTVFSMVFGCIYRMIPDLTYVRTSMHKHI